MMLTWEVLTPVFETGNLPHISSGFVITKKRVPTQRWLLSHHRFQRWRKPGVSLNCNYSAGRIINHHLLLFSEMLWLVEIEFSLTIRKLVSRPTLITGEQLAALLWLRRRQPWGGRIMVAYVYNVVLWSRLLDISLDNFILAGSVLA